MNLKSLALAACLITFFSTPCAALGRPSLLQVRSGGHTAFAGLFLLSFLARENKLKKPEEKFVFVLCLSLFALDVAAYFEKI